MGFLGFRKGCSDSFGLEKTVSYGVELKMDQEK